MSPPVPWTLDAQVQLHPHSVWEVAGVWHGGGGFGGWGDGGGVLAGEAQREDFLERVRFFAEECDSMQVRAGGRF